MIDITSEKPLTLREAASLPFLQRYGRKPHISTIYRWTTGLRGIRLETIVIGGSLRTTESAVIRFCHRLSKHETAFRRTPTQREREIDRSEKELDAAGY
jgi:hypothetical protein